jgi:hypothetical protein
MLTSDAHTPQSRYTSSMVAYGFYADNIEESESMRWLGPARYDLSGFKAFLSLKSYSGTIRFKRAAGEPEDVCNQQFTATRNHVILSWENECTEAAVFSLCAFCSQVMHCIRLIVVMNVGSTKIAQHVAISAPGMPNRLPNMPARPEGSNQEERAVVASDGARSQ